MNKKQLGILFILSLIPFAFYLGKPYMNGTDTYGYNSYNCNTLMQPHLVDTLPTIGSQIIFKTMPCNPIYPKLIMWLIFFSVLVIFGLIGNQFDYDYGWIYGLFACLSPMFITQFWHLEEITFGYPLIFLALYFTIKYIKGKNQYFIPPNNKHNKYYALLFVLLAGLFWKGAIIFLYPLITIIPLLVFPLILITILFGNQILGGILIPNVIESTPIYGWLFLFFLNLFWFRIPKQYWWPLIPLIILFTVSLKYTLFVVPFLLIGIAKTLNSIQHKQYYSHMLIVVCVIAMITTSINGIDYPPTENEVKIIKYAIQEADGNTIYNDWSYGYWIYYYGGHTNYYAGGIPPDYNNVSGIIITKKEEHVQATSLKTGNKLKVWRK